MRPNIIKEGTIQTHCQGCQWFESRMLEHQTMLDSAGSSRPERRSVLIAHELSRLDVNIAVLSEVRFPEEGNLQEHGAGYTSTDQANQRWRDAFQVSAL